MFQMAAPPSSPQAGFKLLIQSYGTLGSFRDEAHTITFHDFIHALV